MKTNITNDTTKSNKGNKRKNKKLIDAEPILTEQNKNLFFNLLMKSYYFIRFFYSNNDKVNIKKKFMLETAYMYNIFTINIVCENLI